MLSVQRTLLALALASVACGGGAQQPAASAPPPAPAGSALEPREAAPDLSPVGAPAGLFVVGRWQRPLTQVDTLGSWLGIPGHVLDFVPERYQGLVKSVDGDAPVEFAAVLTRGKSAAADWVVSIGLTSLAQAVEEARALGAEVVPKAPGIVSLEIGRHQPSCVAALSLGRAPARLVCSSSQRMLDAQLPFATRGLPTLALGSRDLELELRLAPVREAFQTELAGASRFGTFISRQLELDAPRLDRATSETVTALLEELVTFAGDVDVVSLGGGIDAKKSELVLDLDFKFREQKSFIAGLMQDGSRQGPAPEAFFTLPASAESGGYTRGFDKARWTGVRTRLNEIVDAFLEHEKVGRPSRDRARRALDTYFELDGQRAFVTGPAPGTGAVGVSLQLIDNPAKPVVASLADLNALLGDRQVRAMLARRLGVADKSLPKASLVPLSGPGVPAGTRALVVKLPAEFYDGLQKLGLARALGASRTKGGPRTPEVALVAVPRGQGTVIAMAASATELSKLLGDFLSGKGPTLRERAELVRFERQNAAGAYFVTLAGLVSAVAESLDNPALKSTGPGASAPLLFRYEIQKGTSRFGVTVPRALFTGLQALVPALIR